MSWQLEEIGNHVEKIKTWNPVESDLDEEFFYIDLSSVDKDKKTIDLAQVQEVLALNAPSRARQLVKIADILVSTVRPNLNGVARIPDKLNDATASTGYCVLRPTKQPRIQLINATPSESSILSEAISQNTSHGVL